MNNTALQVDDNESLASRADEALQQLLYSAHAFAAVAVPVSLSMILSGIAVVYINDGLNGKSSGGSGIPVLFEETGNESNEQRFAAALANALIYVGVIIGATFLMVFLYYFKFMKLLIGWLVVTTSLLLAFSTGLVVQTGLSLANVPVDAITYSIVFYNFAIVGITAVFYQKGVPSRITGAYLIAISVTMAWILTRYLPEWTSWVLLGVLAFYDLCAVLTPCGPLKWLVGIMQERDEPLPGLLYEARVRGMNDNAAAAATIPSSQTVMNGNGVDNNHAPLLTGASSGPVAGAVVPHPPTSSNNQESIHIDDVESQTPQKPAKPNSLSTPMAAYQVNTSRPPTVSTSGSDIAADRVGSSTSSSFQNHQNAEERPNSVVRPQQSQSAGARISVNPTNAVEQRPPTGTHHVQGPHPDDDYDDDLEDPDRTIKLGLGDFVFYSLLCAKAALVSFTTFIAVFVVVLFGLAMTLVLLAVYRAALPALPISILLGLVFFFAVDAVVVPFALDFASQMAFS